MAFLFEGVVSRIDVLLWDKGQNLYVLDYKSSQNYQQSHKAQVSHYAAFLQTQALILRYKRALFTLIKDCLKNYGFEIKNFKVVYEYQKNRKRGSV